MANTSSSNGLEKRPKLRFPGFDEPWRAAKLSDFADRVTRKNSNNETNLPLTISSKDGLVDQISYFNKTVASKDMSGYYLLRNGEYAYNKSYSVGYDFGSIKRLDRYPMGALSTLYICFALKKHDTDFIKVYFDSLKWYKEIYMISAEGARNHGLLNVPTDEFFATKHYLPENAAEQRKIADFLIALDRRIDAQQSLVDNLKKYKRGLLSREFEQQENGNLNNSYVGKLKDYFQLSSGSTPSSTNRTFYSGNIRWVSSGELKSKYLCETSQHISSEAVSSCNLREYPANTLLIAMYGLEAAGVRGTASILSVPATISQACMAIQQTGEIDIEYLYYWYIYNGQWIGMRIAQGTKQQNLSTDTLGSLRIYAPSYSKQKKVCKLLSQIDYLIEKESKKIDLLSSAKRGLLQQLFI